MKINIEWVIDVLMLEDVLNVVGLKMCGHLEWVEHGHCVNSCGISHIDGVEGVLIEVHFGGVLLQQPHQFENLTTTGAPLKRSLLQHKHHKFVLFVIVFVLETSAAYVSEGSISGENDYWIVHCSELDGRKIFQVLEHLKVEGMLSVVGVPVPC